jgi:hypothetical protein
VTYQRVCPGVPPGARLRRPPWKKLVYGKGCRPCRRGAAPGIPAASFRDRYACTPQQTLAHASSPAACAGNGATNAVVAPSTLRFRGRRYLQTHRRWYTREGPRAPDSGGRKSPLAPLGACPRHACTLARSAWGARAWGAAVLRFACTQHPWTSALMPTMARCAALYSVQYLAEERSLCPPLRRLCARER